MKKAQTKKILTAGILAAIVCSSAFAVSAADIAEATPDSTAAQTVQTAAEQEPTNRLDDGVWQAVDENGDSLLMFVDNENGAIHRISPETGTGVPIHFSYDEYTGIYQADIAYAGNTHDWYLIRNTGDFASLIDEYDSVLKMKRISGDSMEDFKFYTGNELCRMAENYYAETIGSTEGVHFASKLLTDCSGNANVWVYGTGINGGATIDYYTINIQTGMGHDLSGNQINFSQFI